MILLGLRVVSGHYAAAADTRRIRLGYADCESHGNGRVEGVSARFENVVTRFTCVCVSGSYRAVSTRRFADAQIGIHAFVVVSVGDVAVVFAVIDLFAGNRKNHRENENKQYRYCKQFFSVFHKSSLLYRFLSLTEIAIKQFR